MGQLTLAPLAIENSAYHEVISIRTMEVKTVPLKIWISPKLSQLTIIRCKTKSTPKKF